MPKNLSLDDTIVKHNGDLRYFSFDTLLPSYDTFSVVFWSKNSSAIIFELLHKWSSAAISTQTLVVEIEDWFQWTLELPVSSNIKFIQFQCAVQLVLRAHQLSTGSFSSECCEFKELITSGLVELRLIDTQIDKLTTPDGHIDRISLSKRSVIKKLVVVNKWPLITQSFVLEWISRLKWSIPVFKIEEHGEFKVLDSEVDDVIEIQDSSIDLIKIEWKDTVIRGVNIVDSQFDKPDSHPTISIQNVTIDKWILIRNCSQLSKIKLYNIRFKNPDSSIRFEKFSLFDKSIFYLIDLKVAYLSFLDWAILNNQTKFNNIEVCKQLMIEDVNFWTTSFNGFQTSYECEVFIKLPVLKDGVFNNISFGKMSFMESVKLDKLVYKNDLNEMRDVYRQFKYAMDKNNNYIEWNRFFQKEMEYQMKIIQEQISHSGIFRSIALRLEYHVYQLQNLVSNFWNSWIRTMISIVVFTFLATLITSVYMTIWQTWYIYWLEERFTTFLNLLSPFYGISGDTIRNMQDFDKYLWSGFILYKIAYGVLVYQLVVWLKRQTKR